MQWSAAWWSITRDLAELMGGGAIGWAILVFFASLPIAALLIWMQGGRLAILSLVMWIALLAGAVLYYATDWWSNPGLNGLGMGVLTAGVAWGVLVIAWWRLPSRHPVDGDERWS